MVEVFKTDIGNVDQANCLLNNLHRAFTNYRANFDFEDCDKILRVECSEHAIEIPELIDFLKDSGISAEVLADISPLLNQP